MTASLLEILRSVPDHHRNEGRQFELATVLLYAIPVMVAGANSCRQMHEFIRIHLGGLNGAFDLHLRSAPSYTGLRLILRGVDPTALEAAFRRHVATLAAPLVADGLTAIAVDGETLRGSFDAFHDRKAAHMMSALRQAALRGCASAFRPFRRHRTPRLGEGPCAAGRAGISAGTR